MDLGLKNKVIVVTGGSKGIGGGIVCLLANEGAIPVILGRNKESIFKAISDYKQNGYEVGYAIAELTNPNQCEAAIDSIIKNFGRIDGLVNNAGVNDGVGLENGSYEEFINSIKRNLAHYYQIARLVLPQLKKKSSVPKRRSFFTFNRFNLFSVDPKDFEFDIIKSLIIKWMFHLILNIVKRNQNKLAQYDNKEGEPARVL